MLKPTQTGHPGRDKRPSVRPLALPLFAFLITAQALLPAQAQTLDDPWADAVLEYVAIAPNPGFEEPARALGEPAGAGTFAPNNGAVASVGTAGSYITLKFNTPVADDPLNPGGLDCIVFSNAFWAGGNPQSKWVEPGLISISRDANGNGLADDPWYFITGSRAVSPSVLPAGIPNPTPPLAGAVLNPNSTDGDPSNDLDEFDWGYAELTPTQQPYLDNYVRPDDPFEVGLSPRSGGGDAFDIAWAVDAEGNPANLPEFDFLRVWSFLIGSTSALGNITPEVDAAADVAPDIDEDADVILDEYETRVSGTDPARPESSVIALEVPLEEGGSAPGTLLGQVVDAAGNTLALYAAAARTGLRSFNAVVDILPASNPQAALPGFVRTPICREFYASEADFALAQVQNAELVMTYSLLQVSALNPASLTVFRVDGAGYTQDGITSVTHNTEEHWLQFRSRYPGIFVLAGLPLSGEHVEETGLWVDFSWPGDELGTYYYPYNSLSEAVAAAAPSDTVQIKPGTSSETLRITKPLTLSAPEGPVRLGG
ncbi:MAG: hypothetical protein HYZ00_04670 [Candidatus Hydrogenedentes bacterium]|nr:hypothetical protein [Candidatus Hydrogenedentota bacterium]